MLETIRRIFSIAELKTKIVFTLMMLMVCRIGAHIPVPGINGDLAVRLFHQATGGSQNLFQLMDVFSGGAFAHMTIIALGVSPYIMSSIFIQLLMAVIPSFRRDIKESPDQGRRKMGRWIRFLTVGISFFQAAFFAKYAVQMNAGTPGIIVPELLDFQLFGLPWLFYLVVISTMTAGAMFLMWVGEQITEKGIGNGMSLIITLGILSSLPGMLGSIIRQLNLDSQEPGQLSFSSLVVFLSVFVLIIIGTILVIQGQRRIPLQYARRTIGNAETQSTNAYIPLKINYAGVIPVIFASSFLMVPATVVQFVGRSGSLGSFAAMLAPGTWLHTTIYVALIIFFTYFWTATQFHPEQIASDMKKNGAFIPGVRQGKPTQDFLESTMNRITFVGSFFLAFIAILPTLVSRVLGVDPMISHFFGGTSLLILVGVVLDTTKQIESHLLMKRYDGFMRRSRPSGI
ncbi:MAG: preprotein translocase subunit SecY [Rhabdochlamydiaceae bacterium]|jgi:preprotein translocase subunit SecY